jgi:hypothetical protein
MAGPYVIGLPVPGQPISSSLYGIPVKAAINDLDARLNEAELLRIPAGYFAVTAGNPGTAVGSGSLVTLGTLPTSLRANKAYDFQLRSQVGVTTGGDIVVQLFRASGTAVVDNGRIALAGSGDRHFEFRAGFRTPSTLTPGVYNMTVRAQMVSGSVAFKGFASGPLEGVITEVGSFTDYTGRPTY